MLKFDNVTFLYGPGRGVQDVSLSIALGESVGLLGGNGAGKSTLLALGASALLPQSGVVSMARVQVNGRTHTYHSHSGIGFRRYIGFMPETVPVYADMTVSRYLRLRAQIKGERYMRLRRRVNEAILRCGLDAWRQDVIGTLSYGLIRRVALAEAILLLPPVLILDDPFSGIDETMRESLIEVIRDVGQRASVLISGHDPILLARCCGKLMKLQENHLQEMN